ncbi:helix-turn-helix domain-containing protein [Edaphobacter bradus]|uniref:helix-turn-helix domain-containing protein n=1 Tax=Edaphobacter bradus TaxID=2259016 RepID=UPI0021E0BC4B|nr:AraC family transcriptional regulator [Edaphobacter bradus]
MKVVLETRGPVDEPYLSLNREHLLGMTLHPGSMEIGLRRSALRRITFDAGLMGLCPPQSEYWIGTCDMTHVTMTISDKALMAASDCTGSRIELRLERELADPRLRALATAVDVERTADFPNGRLFLDSIEQALARALVVGYGVRDYSVRVYRGGLSPAKLRKIKELVEEKMEEDLSLEEMARTVGLSATHFSEVFRNTTGQTPHQCLLWHRIQRAKEMLRSAEMRVLDVAIACGFKTQQHFARVFRHACGLSPTEYRREFLLFEPAGVSTAFLPDAVPIPVTVRPETLIVPRNGVSASGGHEPDHIREHT